MSTTTSRTSRASSGPGMVPTRQQLDELDALLQRMLALPVHQADDAVDGPALGDHADGLKGPPPRPQPILPPEPDPVPERTYPPAYMVVEDSMPPMGEPVPGGRHDLVEGGVPADPVQEQAAARLREEEQGPAWIPFQSAWQPSAQTWGPLAETWRAARPPEPDPQPPHPPVMPAWVPPPPLPPSLQPDAPSVFTQTVVVNDTPSSPELPAAPAESQPAAAPARVPVVLWPLVAFNACFDLCLWPLGPVGTFLRGATGRGLLGTVGALCLIGAAVVAALDGLGWTW